MKKLLCLCIAVLALAVSGCAAISRARMATFTDTKFGDQIVEGVTAAPIAPTAAFAEFRVGSLGGAIVSTLTGGCAGDPLGAMLPLIEPGSTVPKWYLWCLPGDLARDCCSFPVTTAVTASGSPLPGLPVIVIDRISKD